VKIGLVQINNSFSGQGYLPYSVGLLQAYVEKNKDKGEKYDFLLPVHSRVQPEIAANMLAGADIVGFSVYVWNEQASLRIAQLIKKDNPGCVIVFGGPQVPNCAKDYLNDHRFLDLVCHGEGEIPFLSILRNLEKRSWDQVPSVSYRKNDDVFANKRCKRIDDLETIPSPYISGVFEPLMKAHPDDQWIVLLETNRGCPFSCAFCDWGASFHNKIYEFELDRIFRECDWISKKKIEFVYCCDANFGILGRDSKIVDKMASNKVLHGYPKAFSVQNTKNSTQKSFEIQSRLTEAGMNKGVTLALQTMHKPSLKSVGRQNISTKVFEELQHKFTKSGIETYTDIILGLPEETYETFTDGVSEVIEKGQHNRIQFNNLSLLPNAQINTPEFKDKYGLLAKKTKIINIHGSLNSDSDSITEIQELVVATKSMPPEDWVKTRVFSWFAAFLHFDKVMQIPFIVLHEALSIKFKALIELFMIDDQDYPVLSGINKFFKDSALEIQNGGPEYCASRQWLNIWWPADEFVLIDLHVNSKLDSFYLEAGRLISSYISRNKKHMQADILEDSLRLNKEALKKPFFKGKKVIDLSYNIWDFYRSVLIDEKIKLRNEKTGYEIDGASESWDSLDDWLKKVIWYGNKKGAYLYPVKKVEGAV